MATTQTLKNPTKKKKKKKHIGLRIFLILIIILLVIPLIFISTVLITWKSGKDISNVKDTNINEIVEDKLFEAINDVPNTKQITIQFKEDDLNALLKNATKQIGQPDYIPQIYCSVNGNNYDFGVDVQWKFVKTNIILQTTLTSDSAKDDLLFKLNSIKLGYCPIPNFLYKIVVNKLISDQKLNEIFKRFGLNLQFNLANNEIRYTRTNFINDISNLINKQGNTDTSLINIIMSLIKHNKLFEPVFNGGFGSTIYLNSSEDNYRYSLKKTTYSPRNSPFDFDNDKVRNNVLTIINNSKNSDLTKADADALFYFFVYGYKNSDKTVIDSKVKSWDGVDPIITDHTKYDGVTYIKNAVESENNKNTSLIGQFESQVTNFGEDFVKKVQDAKTAGQTSVQINTNLIDFDHLRQFCASQNIVGFVKPIVRKKNNKYEINYIGIKDFDFQIINNQLCVIATLSINGYEIYVKVSTIKNLTDKDKNLFLKFDDISFGMVNANEIPNLKETLLSLFATKFGQSSKLFSFSNDGITIKVKEAITSILPGSNFFKLFYGEGVDVSIPSQGTIKVKGQLDYNIPDPQNPNYLGLKTTLSWS